jgi:hypothetical protein
MVVLKMCFVFLRFYFDCESEEAMTYLSLNSTGQTCLDVDIDFEFWTPKLLHDCLVKQVSSSLLD